MVDSATEPDREALKVHLISGLEKEDTTFPSPAIEAKWLNQPTMPKSPTAAQTKPPAVQQTPTMYHAVAGAHVVPLSPTGASGKPQAGLILGMDV